MNRRTLALGAVASVCLLAAFEYSKPSKPAIAAPATLEDKLALAATGSGITVGQTMAANTAYVFFDSQCPHCASLWASAQPLLGKIRMQWIPVGVLSPASTTQGGFILGSADPVAAMTEHETRMLQKRGGISVPLAGVDKQFTEKVAKNTEIFNALGAQSVPYLVFRDGRSGQISARASSFSTADLAAVLGV